MSGSDVGLGVGFSLEGFGEISVDKWKLQLQGQSNYEELEGIGDDLRRRGIDCWMSAVWNMV